MRKGDWIPKEDKQLLKIKRGNTDGLRQLAAEWGRDFRNLYNHWIYLIEKGEKKGDISDDAMEFVIDTTITSPVRSDNVEVSRMKRGLDLVIPKLEVNGGSVAISNKLAHSAKRHLESAYPKNRFTLSRQREKGRETGFTRIFKRL